MTGMSTTPMKQRAFKEGAAPTVPAQQRADSNLNLISSKTSVN